MKIQKRNIGFFINKKGMALLQFIILTTFAFMLVGFFIELGYYLKSETVVIGAARNAVRSIEVSGKLDNQIRDNIIDHLRRNNIAVDITNLHIKLNIERNGSIIEVPLTGGISDTDSRFQVLFRERFKLVIEAKHKFKAINFGEASGNLSLPAFYGQEGKGEYFKF